MNPSNLQSEAGEVIEISLADRWQVYIRLQQLDIPCSCATNQPLRVQVQNSVAAIQLWSVGRQLTASRRELTLWLDRCWSL